MRLHRASAPLAAVAWAAQKRRAFGWFVAAAVGAWGGQTLPVRSGLWLVAAVLVIAFLWSWRRKSDEVWGAILLVSIALIAALATSVRLAEYERWEAHYPRGDRRMMRARVVDVLPYAEDRLVLLAQDLDGPSSVVAGRLWVRIVASVDDILPALELMPPSEGGIVEWPVRVYPFTPRGNPGEFDSRMWAMRRGYLATAYLELPRLEPFGWTEGAPSQATGDRFDPCSLSEVALRVYREFGQSSKLRETAWRWRCRLTRGSADDAAAIALAMLLGQKDLIGADLQEAFSRSGLGHLLAVSGLHVGFVLTLAFPLVQRATGFSRRPTPGRATRREWLGYLILCGVVFGFVALTGGPPSAVRAGIMAVAGLGAVALKRQVDTWQALGIAGCALLLAQPLFLFDLGFQMSFLAVGGILAALSLRSTRGEGERRYFGPSTARRVARFVGDSLTITLGAQVATAPVVAYAFSSLSWVSPFVNLAAVPIGGVAVALLAIGVVIGEVWSSLGDGVIRMGHAVLQVLVSLARAVPPWGALEVEMPTPIGVGGWYGLWFGGALYIRAVRGPAPPWAIRIGKAATTVGIVFLSLSLSIPAAKGMLGVAEVWVFDVGQGDSVLVTSGWGNAVLVDGGGVPGAATTGGFDVGERRVVPTLRKLGVRRLQAVINTHPHEDHVHGLAAVIASRRVSAVYASAAESTGAAYRAFLEAAAQKGLEVQTLAVGETLALESGLSLTVLAGGNLAEWQDFGDGGRRPSINDRSVALLLRHRGGTMLLLGDLEERGQRRLIAQGHRLRELSVSDVDVLLLPHHGDGVTAMTGLLDIVQPKAAIVSVGPNRYGHPSKVLLDDLADRGIKVWRTDRHGAVKVEFWPWGMRVVGLRSHPATGGRP